MYITFFNLKLIYSTWQTQIALLFIKKFLILNKYFDFVNIFLKKSTTKLLKYLKINKYTINLKRNKKLANKFFDSFEFIELKTFKIYIKTNLTNNLI